MNKELSEPPSDSWESDPELENIVKSKSLEPNRLRDPLLKKHKKIWDKYHKILPKLEKDFLYELIIEGVMKDSPNHPGYLVEVFTTEGTNPEDVKEKLLHITGAVPTVYGRGTHYVIKFEVSVENLKEINDIQNVTEVTGVNIGESNNSLNAQLKR